MIDLLQDLRIAYRMLRKRPGAGTVVVLSLALGLGINSLFFSSLYAMILRPLPFDEPQDLVQIFRSQIDGERRFMGVADGTFLDWQAAEQAGAPPFEIAAYTFESLNLQGPDDLPEHVAGARVSADLFALLGARPAMGRLFHAGDARPGARVALISHTLWQRSLGGAPEVLGRSLDIDGEAYEVVGVMEEGFAFPLWHQVWLPLGIDAATAARGAGRLQVLGRLNPGVSLSAANEHLAAAAALERAGYGDPRNPLDAHAVPLRDAWLPPVTRTATFVMQGLVGLLLLIVCVNVAGMTTAQASVRRHELALRAALGAGRARLSRQAFIESFLLTGLGGALGLAGAAWNADWMASLSDVEVPYWLSFQLSPAVFAFTGLLVVAVALLVTFLPLGLPGLDVSSTLRSGGRADTGADGGRLRNVLVIVEYAMAVVILVGALLMVRAYHHLAAGDRGFTVDDRVTVSLALTGDGFDDLQRGLTFLGAALETLGAVPGVESVALTSHLPIHRNGGLFTALQAEGSDGPVDDTPRVAVHAVSAGYFGALDIPTVSGRELRAAELQEGAPVARLDRNLARRLWPDGGAENRRVRLGDGPWLTVIGTVEPLETVESLAGTDPPPRFQVYVPYTFAPDGDYGILGRTPTLILETKGDPARLAPLLRRRLAALDPSVAAFDIQTLRRHVDEYFFAHGIWSRMFSFIGAVALLVAAIGAYGMSAFSVSRRRKEIGIRSALGATPRSLMSQVLWRGLALAGAGLVLGLVTAVPMTEAMGRLAAGFQVHDPWVLGGVVALLVAVAVAASFFPARRAASVDPMDTLRQD